MTGDSLGDVLAIYIGNDDSITVHLLLNHFEHMVSGFICIVLRSKFFWRQGLTP